jgi:hypothetical protein
VTLCRRSNGKHDDAGISSDPGSGSEAVKAVFVKAVFVKAVFVKAVPWQL